MTTLAAIRDAVEDQLRDGLESQGFNVCRALTPNIPLPAIVVHAPLFSEGLDYHGTMGPTGAWGSGDWVIAVAIDTALSDELMTSALDIAEPTSDRSIFKVMNADTTLGGVLGTGGFVVLSARSTGIETTPGHPPYWGVEFACKVAARKTEP